MKLLPGRDIFIQAFVLGCARVILWSGENCPESCRVIHSLCYNENDPFNNLIYTIGSVLINCLVPVLIWKGDSMFCVS